MKFRHKIMHWKENTKFCIIRRAVAVMIYQQFADKSLQITIYPETKDGDIQCEPTTNKKWIQVNCLFIFCI